jgi:probable F420-dependent oxidoreductase
VKSAMKLGLNVPNFGPTATPELLRAWVRFAEDHGYAIAMMSDHVAPTPDVIATYPSPFYDPFATLAWLAGQTTRIELGTTVAVAPYRHPLHTARLATNIDQFSGGRFVLGLGVGWSAPEFAALGLSFADRGRQTDEYLAAIARALAEPTVPVNGQDVDTGPASVRKPHVPIWVGGSVPAAIRRAVRFGQAWHPINPTVEWVRETGLPMLRAVADELSMPVPAFCPRVKAGVADVGAFFDLGAEYVVVDTNPDHPDDRRSPQADWELLARIAARG